MYIQLHYHHDFLNKQIILYTMSLYTYTVFCEREFHQKGRGSAVLSCLGGISNV